MSNLRGFSDYHLAAFGKPGAGNPGFDSVTVDTIAGSGSGTDANAQKPRPGDYSWPDPAFGDQGGLNISVLDGANYHRSSVACL